MRINEIRNCGQFKCQMVSYHHYICWCGDDQKYKASGKTCCDAIRASKEIEYLLTEYHSILESLKDK